ncbi:DNA-processing protein DprA [Burkholderiaceae bacterium DAT-1]|nr:DNA-processing protein DprA [Burkholderiaceae bacterium DAT-1]
MTSETLDPAPCVSSAADAESWLRLALIPGIGSQTLIRLLQQFGSPEAALGASRSSLSGLLNSKQLNAFFAGCESDLLARHLSWLAQPDNHLLTLADTAYPQQLLDIADPPALLFAKGRVDLLSARQIAVVGSRHATPQGVANAEAFAEELAKRGLTITSGLAAGIDSAAHRGGLAGDGKTVAVVGTGLDIVYPAGNLQLAHQIAAHGVLVSEFPLGTPGRMGNFPRRNRIISGLSVGVLVVEATLGSGSLITARQAAEQGREVFAIPGSIHAPQSRGCHALIREGAKLVERADDITEDLKPSMPPQPADNIAELTPEAARCLGALGYDPVDIDTLCDRTRLTVEDAYAILLTLELSGHVARLPGGSFQRI